MSERKATVRQLEAEKANVEDEAQNRELITDIGSANRWDVG